MLKAALSTLKSVQEEPGFLECEFVCDRTQDRYLLYFKGLREFEAAKNSHRPLCINEYAIFKFDRTSNYFEMI